MELLIVIGIYILIGSVVTGVFGRITDLLFYDYEYYFIIIFWPPILIGCFIACVLYFFLYGPVWLAKKIEGVI